MITTTPFYIVHNKNIRGINNTNNLCILTEYHDNDESEIKTIYFRFAYSHIHKHWGYAGFNQLYANNYENSDFHKSKFVVDVINKPINSKPLKLPNNPEIKDFYKIISNFLDQSQCTNFQDLKDNIMSFKGSIIFPELSKFEI